MSPHRIAALLTLLAGTMAAMAQPTDFMVSLPPPWTLQLDLPSPTSQTNADELGSTTNAPLEPSVRTLRDNAIRAYEKSDYAGTIEFLDGMESVVPLPPSLRVLRAWCATYAGEDERAAALWSALAAADSNDARRVFMAGWHRCRLGYYRDAYTDFSRALAINPLNRDAQHMAGICAWGAGHPAIAQRHLVRAMRMTHPLPESFLAMAAIQVADHSYAAAVGWIRKGLDLLPPDHRSYWLGRQAFTQLWQMDGSSWQALLGDFEMPSNRDDVIQLGNEEGPLPKMPTPTPPSEPQGLTILDLSPFSRDPAVRAKQMAAYSELRMLQRIALREIAADNVDTNLSEDVRRRLTVP